MSLLAYFKVVFTCYLFCVIGHFLRGGRIPLSTNVYDTPEFSSCDCPPASSPRVNVTKKLQKIQPIIEPIPTTMTSVTIDDIAYEYVTPKVDDEPCFCSPIVQYFRNLFHIQRRTVVLVKAKSINRSRISPPHGLQIDDILPDNVLSHVAKFLAKPSREIFAVAMTAPPSSWQKCSFGNGSQRRQAKPSYHTLQVKTVKV